MKKLGNKIAVVTGGNSGIGLAVAKLFAEEEAKVVVTGRDPVSIRNAVLASDDSSYLLGSGLVADGGFRAL